MKKMGHIGWKCVVRWERRASGKPSGRILTVVKVYLPNF
jgi:hypothetical protein